MDEQPSNNQSQTPPPEFGSESRAELVQPFPAEPHQPVRVHLKTSEQPPFVSYSLLAVTVVVYLFQFGSQYLAGVDIPAGVGMKINEYILRGEYWRFITPVFLHGSLLHIAFNMYAVNVLGPSLERFYGHWQFLAMYLISGFAGVVGSFAFTANPSLGASTAVFGLLAAQGVFAYRNQQVFGARARSVFHNVIRIAFINLLIGMTPGIDNWGHLGGLLGGLMIAWLGGPIYTIRGSLPDLEGVNTRGQLRYILAAGLTLLVFGLIAVGIIYSRL